jgi:hypothetical protein
MVGCVPRKLSLRMLETVRNGAVGVPPTCSPGFSVGPDQRCAKEGQAVCDIVAVSVQSRGLARC